VDVDTAAHVLGQHVEAEVDKKRRDEEKALNPKPARSTGRRSSSSTSREYRHLSDDRRREIWVEVVARVVDGTLVWHDAPPSGETGRWRTEKPITGNRLIDEVQHKGARVVYDGQGRRRAEFDADGQRVFFWKPEG